MNNKIPFHELSARVAATTGISPESAESFVKSFFEILSESLVKGESVRVKGLGSFTVSVTNGEKTVDFILDKDLSESINAPFSIFEPVALNDEVTEEMLSEITQQDDTQKAETSIIECEKAELEQEHIEPCREEALTPTTAPIEAVKEEITETDISESKTTDEIIDKDKSEVVATEITDDSLSTEVAETVTGEEITEENIVADESTSITSEPEAKVEEVDATLYCPVGESTELKEDVEAEIPDETPIVQEAVRPAPVITPLDEEPEEYVERRYEEPSGKGNFWWGLAVGLIVGLALGACGVYLAIDHIFPTSSKNDIIAEEVIGDELAEAMHKDSVLIAAQQALSDSAASTVQDTVVAEVENGQAAEIASPEAVVPAVRRDTVRRGYLIHDMAKKFYGSKDYWVYIYEENKSKIGNPNNMQPGVVLVIPPAEKYGIVPGDPESQKRAKNKAGEILSKFPR